MRHPPATVPAPGDAVPDNLDLLRRRLDDPAVVAALGDLLDHADLLAVLVSGLDGLVRRGDTVTDSLAAGLAELRAGSDGLLERITAADLAGLARSLSTLARALVDTTPALDKLIRSDLFAPETVDMISMAGRAVVRGHARAQAHGANVGGVRAVFRLLRDPDVARGLGFLGEVARSLGQELNRTAPRGHQG